MSNDKKRPFLVTLIGILFVLAGLFFLATGAMMYLDVAIDALPSTGVGETVSIVYGIILIIVAAGFLRGWSIMWYLGVLFGVISLLLTAASVVMGTFSNIITVIVVLIILFYLFKRNVKDFFLN